MESMGKKYRNCTKEVTVLNTISVQKGISPIANQSRYEVVEK